MKVFRQILRVLGSLALLGYLLFLIGEKVPLLKAADFVDVSVYLLFAVFLIGYVLLWKHELTSGIIFIAWYVMQWSLVLWVWEDGGMTLIFGFPIAIIGTLLLIYGFRSKMLSRREADKKN